ncbi:MAG: dihydroorotate dehydrogenase [Paracoccaceae bacterium]
MGDDDKVDLLFSALRAQPPEVSSALRNRVLADAYALQPAPRPVRARLQQMRGLRALISGLGGVGGLAGLGTAAVAGLFFGYAQPVSVDWLSSAFLATPADSVDLLSAADFFVTGG